MQLTVSHIMTREIISLTPQDSLKDAHNITREKGIRHLPVLDPLTGKFLGLVTQKKMISKVISLLSLYGEKALERREGQVNVMDIAEMDCQCAQADEPLQQIASYFLNNKHGCLPIIDQDKQLLGVVTSSDFVRLSIMLMGDNSTR